MKKILLSVLCGFMIIGSASALPSPEDRKALCEKQPDKFVWIEKNKTCIPVDPCQLEDDSEIKTIYCLDKVFINLPKESDKRDMILDRYFSKVLNTSIKNKKLLETCSDEDEGVWCSKTIAITTTDDGYFVASYGLSTVNKEDKEEGELARWNAHMYAIDSYGYKTSPAPDTEDYRGKTFSVVKDKQDCVDIADFASLLFDDIIEYEFRENTKECVLK